MAQFKTLDILAAAVAAFRHNGNAVVPYVPTHVEGILPLSNIKILKSIIDPSVESIVQVTNDDKIHAEEIISDLQRRYTMSMLNNKPLNEFSLSILNHLGGETVSDRAFGVIIWAPNLYMTMHQADEKMNHLNMQTHSSGYIGAIGDKIELKFHAVFERYHKEYNCWRYTGHDGHGNLVGFLKKDKLIANDVTIKAKVKGHETSKFTRGKTTILNYVKEIQDAQS